MKLTKFLFHDDKTHTLNNGYDGLALGYWS